MKPPKATSSTQKGAGATQPAVFSCVKRITKRSDFIQASHAKRLGVKGFLLQARNRNDDDQTIRVGFTCSKKVGNAVARNRAKRRLREITNLILISSAKKGWDYVLIGKKEVTASRDFIKLKNDLTYALQKIHK
ncbi:ribonuclease P protein component [Amylibacter sp.]|jgi:ribonuclease P protein component|nr:ribonuclease P protein component [alpha proteobacterium HTCC2255] [Rhodobacterales bacterium HTCC2255]MBT3954310.1 ribonuclease P protein component [Rhodobacterales bacterium]MCO4796280.1 ribonuclease P protein component [Amylibacter sp.]MBT4133773.1 ribonuclease P protein component [Rhodobacterales bacterium]MBT4322773.1 ribonuclease P protein component [Rhodobacterales bacterium]